MTRKKPEAEPEAPKADPFIDKLQGAMEKLLDIAMTLEPKDLNPLFANCIKFLQVKHNITDRDDGGSYFGDD